MTDSQKARGIELNLPPKLELVRCVDCTHAVIDAGIAQCQAGAKSGLPTRGYWYTDPHVCPWHFKSRDSPDAEK